jgi:hypothetical protein
MKPKFQQEKVHAAQVSLLVRDPLAFLGMKNRCCFNQKSAAGMRATGADQAATWCLGAKMARCGGLGGVW